MLWLKYFQMQFLSTPSETQKSASPRSVQSTMHLQLTDLETLLNNRPQQDQPFCELSARKAAAFVNFRTDLEVSSGKAVFVDIRYTDLVKEPIETVSAVYKAADMELSDDVKSKMARYLDNNKQHKYGKHKYTLQEYGLNEAVVDDAFKPYRQFFDLWTII